MLTRTIRFIVLAGLSVIRCWPYGITFALVWLGTASLRNAKTQQPVATVVQSEMNRYRDAGNYWPRRSSGMYIMGDGPEIANVHDAMDCVCSTESGNCAIIVDYGKARIIRLPGATNPIYWSCDLNDEAGR